MPMLKGALVTANKPKAKEMIRIYSQLFYIQQKKHFNKNCILFKVILWCAISGP
jgi:hypothetical protein